MPPSYRCPGVKGNFHFQFLAERHSSTEADCLGLEGGKVAMVFAVE